MLDENLEKVVGYGLKISCVNEHNPEYCESCNLYELCLSTIEARNPGYHAPEKLISNLIKARVPSYCPSRFNVEH